MEPNTELGAPSSVRVSRASFLASSEVGFTEASPEIWMSAKASMYFARAPLSASGVGSARNAAAARCASARDLRSSMRKK